MKMRERRPGFGKWGITRTEADIARRLESTSLAISFECSSAILLLINRLLYKQPQRLNLEKN